MNPLDALLRPAVAALNHNIRELTSAGELCEALDGRVVAIRVANTALSACALIDANGITLTRDLDVEPDVVISGSMLSLLRLAGRNREQAIRDGSVDIDGDAETAQLFQELLDRARLDPEEALSSVVGDVAAHQVGEFARGLKRWSRNARRTMGMNISEYLQEEGREVPSRYEVERFAENVGELRDSVARLEARLRILEDRP